MLKMTRKETQVSLVRNLFIGIQCFTADHDILSLGGLSSGSKPTSAGGAMEDHQSIIIIKLSSKPILVLLLSPVLEDYHQ